MTDLKPDHPAVRAANMGVQEWLALPAPFDDDPVRLAHDMTAACITAALPHLTADDLRNTRPKLPRRTEFGDGGELVVVGGKAETDLPQRVCGRQPTRGEQAQVRDTRGDGTGDDEDDDNPLEGVEHPLLLVQARGLC